MDGMHAAVTPLPPPLPAMQVRAGTGAEVEAFVHGALCVSYSGQCFSSEAWGGRSANRGQCAQACRMPYGLLVDGTLALAGDMAYVLSPQDLMAVEHVSAHACTHVWSVCEQGVARGFGVGGQQPLCAYLWHGTVRAQHPCGTAARAGRVLCFMHACMPRRALGFMPGVA